MNFLIKEDNEPFTNNQIKDGLKEEGTLFIEEFTYQDETIKELIGIFGEYSFKYKTISNKRGKVMCNPSKKRSFCDLYCFIIHYRPNATVKTVKEKVREAILDGLIYPTVCGVIMRGVYLFKPFQIGEKHDINKYKQNLDKEIEFGMSIGEFYNLS